MSETQNIPNPDPSLLTTAQLYREVGHLRDNYDLRMDQTDLRHEQRFQAQSKALDAALASANAKTDALSQKIDELREFQYNSLGKENAIPTQATQLQQLSAEVAALRDYRASTVGTASSRTQYTGWIFAGVSAIATLLTIFFSLKP